MKFLKRLWLLGKDHEAAIETSRTQLQEALATDPEVDAKHERALAQLQTATAQAKRLGASDRRNHYSESLTLAFRERPTS